MRRILLLTAVAVLTSSAASAAPLSPVSPAKAVIEGVEAVRLVCNEWGRCYRVRGPRYYGGYGYGPSYGYAGPGYYRRHYHGGPSFGLRFGY